MAHNILIIDDSYVDCKMMAVVLKRSDPSFNIFYNHKGDRVFEQIIKEDISVIILDLMIESIDGIEILKAIKANLVMAEIPVIICSSIGAKETIKDTLMLGAHDYFEKPLSDISLEFGFALKVKNALEIKTKTDHLNFLRNHDDLTGLATRKLFEWALDKAIQKQALPLCVVMLDINGLKVINDAYGYDVGDKILIEVSQIILGLKEECMCSARWGSDEFAILLAYENQEVLEAFMQALKTKVDTCKQYHYDISFGWAVESHRFDKAKYLVQRAEDNLYSNKILEAGSIRSNMIESFIKTLHHKNPREELHSHRVRLLSGKIAEHLGFSTYEVKRVELAGLMHDIGKISISEDILNKPGRLDQREWAQVKRHPEYGFKILSTSVDTLEIAKAVLAHHERWDGQGYPRGISRENIPIMARIIAVADTFDAITSERTYRDTLDDDQAIAEIKGCSGSQFDPKVVEAFLAYQKSL